MKTILKSPYFVGALLSVLASLVILYHQQPPNSDGFKYLKVAVFYLNHDYTAARQLFNWPFYPVLFAEVYRITGVSLENAVILLNAFLSLTLVFAFTLTVQLIYQKRHYVWSGLLIILCFQTYNHVRHDIIRGHGYWTFVLLALCCLLQLAKTKQWRYGILWAITISIATLFRIEGAIFLLFGSLFLLRFTKHDFWPSVYLLIKANMLFVLGGIMGGMILLTYYHIDIIQLSRLAEVLYVFLHPVDAFMTPYQQVVQHMQDVVLPVVAKSNADRLLTGGILLTVLWVTFTSLTPVYAVFSAYGLYHRVLPKPASRFVYGWVFLNLVLLTLFVFRLYFLDKRYVLFLCLLLMLWIPGGLVHLYEKMKSDHYSPRKKYLIITAILLAFVYLVIASLGHFGVSKAYITQGSRWLQHNRAPDTLVITNNHKINYYSRGDILDDQRTVELSGNDVITLLYEGGHRYPAGTYIALVVSRHKKAQFDINRVSLLYTLEKQYRNRRGDQLFVFKKL